MNAVKTVSTLSAKVEAAISGTTLYYPCSGSDLKPVLDLFGSVIRHYWFVDIAEDWRRDLATLLGSDYQLIDRQREGRGGRLERRTDATTGREYPFLEPTTVSETYAHLPTQRTITIHRCRGLGVSRFQALTGELGVFFYRGDSPGEGGSGNVWLHREKIAAISARLVDGGLLITDGSQHDRSGRARRYEPLWHYHDHRTDLAPAEIVASLPPIEDEAGRTLTCIGFAGYRYGPTLIWQIRRQPNRNF